MSVIELLVCHLIILILAVWVGIALGRDRERVEQLRRDLYKGGEK